jgi:hypothetical protein
MKGKKQIYGEICDLQAKEWTRFSESTVFIGIRKKGTIISNTRSEVFKI